MLCGIITDGVGDNHAPLVSGTSRQIAHFLSTQEQEVFGEETPDGFLLFRTEDEKVAGMTIIGYWKRFGEGQLAGISWNGLQLRLAA